MVLSQLEIRMLLSDSTPEATFEKILEIASSRDGLAGHIQQLLLIC